MYTDMLLLQQNIIIPCILLDSNSCIDHPVLTTECQTQSAELVIKSKEEHTAFEQLSSEHVDRP